MLLVSLSSLYGYLSPHQWADDNLNPSDLSVLLPAQPTAPFPSPIPLLPLTTLSVQLFYRYSYLSHQLLNLLFKASSSPHPAASYFLQSKDIFCIPPQFLCPHFSNIDPTHPKSVLHKSSEVELACCRNSYSSFINHNTHWSTPAKQLSLELWPTPKISDSLPQH